VAAGGKKKWRQKALCWDSSKRTEEKKSVRRNLAHALPERGVTMEKSGPGKRALHWGERKISSLYDSKVLEKNKAIRAESKRRGETKCFRRFQSGEVGYGEGATS